MAKSKHVHKFVSVKRTGYTSKIWKCALPDCTWFVHPGLSHVMLGKPSTCWTCEEVFIIDESALKDDMPKCADCRTPLVASSGTPSDPIERTPEQQRAYEREMREMFGADWRKLLEK